LGEASANIDDTTFTAAANICDQTNTDAGTTRYTMNGSFTTGSTPVDFLQDAITSMGATLWYNQGAWKVKAAAWTAASVNFDENDLRSGISLATRKQLQQC
jgi:UDP-N-acetylglucosamine enolpyruvyl transferase